MTAISPSANLPSLALVRKYPYTPLVQTAARALLAQEIAASGLSVGAYAREPLLRDGATVHKWLTGKKHIPRAVLVSLFGPQTQSENHHQ